MQANDIRKGSIIIHKGELWQAVEVEHCSQTTIGERVCSGRWKSNSERPPRIG